MMNSALDTILNFNTKKRLENIETFLNSKKDQLAMAIGPNPLTTPVGIKIDIATSPEMTDDNWAAYLEICDIINNTPDGPKDAVRAIRKKMHQSSQYHFEGSIIRTLNLTDCCIKNCGHRFHFQLANKRDFAQDMIKCLAPKYNPSLAIQEKVLSLIHNWAKDFRKYPDLQGLVQLDAELRSKGILAPSLDNSTEYFQQNNQRNDITLSSKQQNTIPTVTNENANTEGEILLDLKASDILKLREEIRVVRTNKQLFTELMAENEGKNMDPDSLILIQKLHGICKDMQTRIQHLLAKITDETLLTELLGVNDELNTVFNKYNTFESQKLIGSANLSESSNKTSSNKMDHKKFPTTTATITDDNNHMAVSSAHSFTATPSTSQHEMEESDKYYEYKNGNNTLALSQNNFTSHGNNNMKGLPPPPKSEGSRKMVIPPTSNDYDSNFKTKTEEKLLIQFDDEDNEPDIELDPIAAKSKSILATNLHDTFPLSKEDGPSQKNLLTDSNFKPINNPKLGDDWNLDPWQNDMGNSTSMVKVAKEKESDTLNPYL